jgi:hypothetical protein
VTAMRFPSANDTDAPRTTACDFASMTIPRTTCAGVVLATARSSAQSESIMTS